MKNKIFYCFMFLISSTCAAEPRQHIPDVINQHAALQTSFSGGNRHLISRQMIATTGALTLSDILQSAGGLQLHDASGTGSQTLISMRGFGANAGSNTLLLINGIPITNPDIMPPDINAIPLEAINQIEITAGSESVLYGDQAVGGIINIITDHATEKNIRLQCNAGSYQARECHASIANFYRALNYQASLTSKSTDNYREHNHYLNNTLLGSALYKNIAHEIEVDYKFTHENMQYPGALTAAQVRQDRNQAANTTDYFKDDNQYLHLSLKNPLHEQWKLNTDVLLNNMNGNGVL
jgi:iron complex outermembrane receptor protein